MTAIVKGIPIVSTSWLDECYKQKRFVSCKYCFVGWVDIYIFLCVNNEIF